MIWTDSTLAALWIAFWLYWLVSAFTAKRSVRTYRQGYFLARLVLIVMLVLVLRLPTLRPYFVTPLFPSSSITGILAVGLCAAGLGFAVWARVHLGKNWGMPMTMREEPELITSGPYRLVRHPIYSGILLALLGSFIIGRRVWLLVFLYALAYFVFSALTEEKLMAEQFPEQYPEYKKRSKMIVPFIF